MAPTLKRPFPGRKSLNRRNALSRSFRCYCRPRRAGRTFYFYVAAALFIPVAPPPPPPEWCYVYTVCAGARPPARPPARDRSMPTKTAAVVVRLHALFPRSINAPASYGPGPRRAQEFDDVTLNYVLLKTLLHAFSRVDNLLTITSMVKGDIRRI